MSSITTPKRKKFLMVAQVTFFKGFLGKISAILLSCIMKKNKSGGICKWNRLGYWNSCKHLPNLVNVAALLVTHLRIQTGTLCSTFSKAFRNSGALATHLRIHTGTLCSTCSKAFHNSHISEYTQVCYSLLAPRPSVTAGH